MSKWLAIDYGTKRCGLAETDDLQLMAFGLTAVDTPNLMPFLQQYVKTHSVEKIIIGYSLNLQGKENPIEEQIHVFIESLKTEFPDILLDRQDERFTSKMAERSLFDMGKKKKDRQNKYLVDEISATLILQSYLQKKII